VVAAAEVAAAVSDIGEAFLDARAILEGAVRRGVVGFRLVHGMDENAVVDLGRKLGVAVPPMMRELLLYAAGFHFEPFGSVSFVDVDSFAFEDLLPTSIALAGDGGGNFWVVDVNSQTGAWGRVVFVSHDPPVLVVQAADLSEFIEQVLGIVRPGQRQAWSESRDTAVSRAWRDEPYLMSRTEALASGDELVAEFAERVPEPYRIADLRGAPNGVGFSWGRAGPAAKPRRCGAELLFAVEVAKRGSFLSRLLRRS
jgi:SMI1/KNR4 family protein SUKH-1